MFDRAMRGQTSIRHWRSGGIDAGDSGQVATGAAAAVSMSLTTSSGWETIGTWLVGTSTVVAPMRLANTRSASGGIA